MTSGNSTEEPDTPDTLTRRSALRAIGAGGVVAASLATGVVRAGQAGAVTTPRVKPATSSPGPIVQSPFSVAVVTASSVEFDLAKSVEKAVALISRAAAKGAKVVAFGELWLPGYPKKLNFDSNWLAKQLPIYQKQALVVGDSNWSAIGRAARKYGVVVAMGYSERNGQYLYMGQTVFGSDGTPLIIRRKIRPSGSERNIWSDRPLEDNIQVVPTELGRIGALECWEHLHPFMTFNMEAQLESIHIAAWPYNSLPGADVQWWEDVEVALSACRLYAITSGAYVLLPGVGYGAVFAPTGQVLAATTTSPATDLVFATVDPTNFSAGSYDTTGEYSWGVLQELKTTYPGPRVKDTQHQQLNLVPVPS